jgi:hypothetical protein
MRVLVLGARAPAALDYARRFSSQGATTFIADSIPCRLAGFSRSVKRAFRLPPPRYALGEFVTELCRIITSERIDLVLPTCEEVFYLSRIRDRLPTSCNVFVAPFEQLRLLHSKMTFLTLANQCGARVPPSVRVQSLAEAREWAGSRAVVLKPEFSRFGVHVRIYREGIPANAPMLSPSGPWVAQDFLEGRELCSYSIAVNGVFRAHVAYEPKYRLARSSSYYFDPVSASETATFVERLVMQTGFNGQIAFDWIEGADGRLSILECNPRAVSGVHLFGANDSLADAIAQQEGSLITPTNPRARMLALVMLFAGLPAALGKGTFRQWSRDWSRAEDVLCEPGDRRPLLGAICDLASYARLALKQGCSMRAAATRDIEWDGEVLPE